MAYTNKPIPTTFNKILGAFIFFNLIKIDSKIMIFKRLSKPKRKKSDLFSLLLFLFSNPRFTSNTYPKTALVPTTHVKYSL